MTMQRAWIGLMATCLLTAGLAAQTPSDAKVVKRGDNLVEVTVTGVGTSKDDASRDARRKAVEAGAGTFIYSNSKVENFQLMKDTILARSAGFCQSAEELSARELDDGTWEIKVKAVVSIKGIEDQWGVVTNLLKDVGRPKIMVFIPEKVDTDVRDVSTVQTKIEDLLLKSGFLLVDQAQIKAIDKKDLTAAIAEDKPDKVQAIAKRFGAHIFITGSAEAQSAGRSHVSGVELFKYGATGNVRCYRTDTAQLIASKNGTQAMPDRVKNIAADRSLKELGEQLGPQVLEDILQFWQDALEGRGELKLEVENVTFAQRTAIKKALETIKEVKQANSDQFANKVATYSIQSEVSAEKLAEIISEKIVQIEINDVTANVIKGAYKAD